MTTITPTASPPSRKRPRAPITPIPVVPPVRPAGLLPAAAEVFTNYAQRSSFPTSAARTGCRLRLPASVADAGQGGHDRPRAGFGPGRGDPEHAAAAQHLP